MMKILERVFGCRRAKAQSLPDSREAVLCWEISQKMARVRARIRAAARHLSGDWRSPEGKEAFVKELYDGRRPSYLWFAVPAERVEAEDVQRLRDIFWPQGGPDFGDLELHPSGRDGVVAGLRIRDPEVLLVEVEVGGQVCPLYQVGHADMFGMPDEAEPCCSLIDLVRLGGNDG